MKRLLLLTLFTALILNCSGRKRVEKALYAGNYNEAIAVAIDKLKTNKDKKRKQDYVVMLKEAYFKAVERDLQTLERLKRDNNPEQFRTIFEIYTNLDLRQEAIKPLMPLHVNRKIVDFNFNDYSRGIAEYRDKTSDYLYEVGLDLLDSGDKYKIREAYNTYDYIESINPNYDNTRELMEEAHAKGTDYVSVTIENRTHQVIPRRLEDDLLNFDTYGLNQFWTVYHANPDSNIDYDYAMQLQLKQINISPERISERQILREREIVDGWEYKLDRNGNVVKDSLGNDIKIDKIITVKARFFEFEQTKSTQIIADVVYIDLNTNQLIDTFTIDSGFVFENFFATVRGDKRALEAEDRRILENRQLPFPSNEQMVYDCGEDLKRKLKDIISSFKVRG